MNNVIVNMVFKHSHAKQVLGEKKIDDKWEVICVHTTTLMLVLTRWYSLFILWVKQAKFSKRVEVC
jgi:hypothetical protein